MASASKESRGKCATHRPGKVKVTILASEWGSSKSSVSTINTMLSIQLAKSSEVEISFFVPHCSEEDKAEALRHNIRIVKATQLVGYEDLELLSFPPDDLQIEVVVGHGVKLGRQGQVIKKSHGCKWVQVVHTDLEEIGMFKGYPDSISRGEEEHNDEVKLCEKADFVVGIGPKVTEAFHSYLRFCKNEGAIFDFTPGIFEEFLSVKQVHEERNCRIVLVVGRGGVKDFKLKGFDIAGKAIALLVDTRLVFVGAPTGSHDEVKEFFIQCGLQVKQLRVRSDGQSQESLKQLFCEADLLLMPSRTNGFGLAGLEALSAGLPVLVSKNSGFGEALFNVTLNSPFVVDSDNPDVWAAAIQNIVRDKARHLWLDEAKRIRMLYYEKYSWPKQSDTLRSKIIELADGKNDQSLQATTVETLKIGQRVVTFGEDNDNPIRGTVRFVGEEKDTSGRVLVGLELDERIGSGTGKWKGRQHFVDIQTVISERDFDGVPGEAMTRTTSQKQDKQHTNSIKQEKRQNKETFARSSSYDVNRASEKETAILESQVEVLKQQLSAKEECLASYQAQVEEGNVRETSLIQLLEKKELQRENSQRQLLQQERQLQKMKEQIRKTEDGKTNLERQLEALAQSFDTQLGMNNQELSELETSLSAAQQMIIELRRQESCDWVISRGEIQVKDKCLGRGAWGSVNEATYCGCKVAVKQIHELILSAHNRRLFVREMNIASRCRHPCLLQFIGATNDEGSPLFVTELMEMSLRALLGQRKLTETEISVISLDVSQGLNYLHHMKPSPIVHRDVSSANVLLWRQGEQWRGKVSDYGTAKFVQQNMTVAPGALIYSAPEAVSSNQTSKVDVYSFGVLLCEMCIGEMPDPERREEQVLLVRNRLFRNLVRQCLQADPAMRPDMAQIIQELEQCDGTDRLI